MNKFLLLLTTLQLGLLSSAHAEWVRYQNYKLQFELPKEWQVVTDLYGMPVTVLGPDRGGQRAVLSVQHTYVHDVEINHSEMESSQADYFDGRRAWLEGQDAGKFLSPIPYHRLYDGKSRDGFEIGYHFKIHGDQFEERSAQVSCGGRLYFVKTLAGQKTTSADRRTLTSLVNQFQCAAVTEKDGVWRPGPLHEIQDKIRAERVSDWPGIKNFKHASNVQKAESLEALVEFYKNYDDAAEFGDETVGNRKPFGNTAFALLKANLEKLMPNACADGAYHCFFGGWPSNYVKKNGHTSCDYPNAHNSHYPQDKCVGQLACNPALFGPDLCVDDNTPALRAHITLACDLKFKEAGKKYEDVVAAKDFDNGLLEETLNSARTVCGQDNYSASNYGLCHTLEDKLNVSLNLGKRDRSDEDSGFIQHLDQLESPKFKESLGTLTESYQDFEKNCIDEKGNFKPEIAECNERLKSLTDDFNRVEKTEAQGLSQAGGGTASNNNCEKCDKSQPGDDPTPTGEATGGKCDAGELQLIKDQQCNWGSASWWANSAGSCVKNLYRSMMNDLMGTVTALPTLVISGAKAAYHGFKRMVGLENETSNKALEASGTSPSLLSQFMAHPWDTAQTTVASAFKAILETIVSFMKEDIFCQNWEGSPHVSKCLVPGNFGCLSCLTKINGACTIAGYVVAEALPTIITGGIAAFAKDGALALKVTNILGKFSKEGKLGKLAAEIEAKVPALAKIKALKAPGIVEKAAVAASDAKKIGKIRTVLNVIKDFKNSFGSRFGGFKATLAKLNSYKVIRIPKNVVVGTGKFIKGVGALPYKPYEYLYQFGFKTARRMGGGVILESAKSAAAASAIVKDTELVVAEGKALSEEAKLAKAAEETAASTGGAGKATNSPNASKASNASSRGPLLSPRDRAIRKYTLPETEEFIKTTKTYEGNLKTLAEYQFTDPKKAEKAKTIFAAQDDLMKKTKAAQKLTHARSSTLDAKAEHIKELRDAQKNFQELDKNNKKILSLIQSDNSKAKVPTQFKAPETVYGFSSKYKHIIYMMRARVAVVGGNAASNIATMNEFGQTNEDFNSDAKRHGMSPEAYRAAKRKDVAKITTQQEIRAKIVAGETPSAEDEKRIVATGISMEEFLGQCDEMITMKLMEKAHDGDAYTDTDRIQMKRLDLTPEKLK